MSMHSDLDISAYNLHSPDPTDSACALEELERARALQACLLAAQPKPRPMLCLWCKDEPPQPASNFCCADCATDWERAAKAAQRSGRALP